MLKAGLEGIKKNEKHPKPVEEDVYEFTKSELDEKNIAMLPGSLGEALAEMEKSNLIKDALGEHAFINFLRAKRAEWDEYRIRVTPWEIDRYLEMI
jgi:glutamine synthetase